MSLLRCSYPFSVHSPCKRFISTICIPIFEPSSLVSGGGDPYLNIWDWMSGTLRCQIPIADTVRPFVKVRGKRHGGQNTPGARGRKGRGRGRKAKESPEEVATKTGEPSTISDEIATAASTFEEDFVLALGKVEAFEFNSEKLLIFSAIGYALRISYSQTRK